jgi:DNA-binding LytR/AlgR family response regulator
MKSKVKCLIVDDEPLAIEVLKSHISKLDSLEISGIANDAFEAFDFLNKQKVDLMFLDIHMPEMKGTELLKTLKNPPAVVFTTAYREYALEGYDLNVLDYLLKPISFKRFIQAIEKFISSANKDHEITLQNQGKSGKFLYLKEKNLIHKIPLNKIVYVESMGDNVTIHTIKHKITNRCTISSIEKLLSESGFLRIHRSFIVSVNRITSFSPASVYIDNKEFPIGTSYKKIVFDILDFNGLLNK